MPTALLPTTQDLLRAARKCLEEAREALKRKHSGVDEADPVFKSIANAQADIDAELRRQANASPGADELRRRFEAVRRIFGQVETIESLSQA